MNEIIEHYKILLMIFLVFMLPMFITLGLIAYDMKKNEKREKKS